MRINQGLLFFLFYDVLYFYYFFDTIFYSFKLCRGYFLLFLLLELKTTDIYDYFNLMIKVNILILVRVIKEMTTMQSTGDNHIQQIR